MLVYGSYVTDDDPQSTRDGGASSNITSSSSSSALEWDESQQRLLPAPRDKSARRDREKKTMTLAEVLYAYDLTAAQLVYQRFGRHPGARLAWELLSHTGDGILWFLMVLPVVGLLWLAGYLDNVSASTRTVFISFYTCNFVDIIAIIIMKLAFKRERPPHHRTDGRFVGPDQHSFPSGHATRVWCLVALFLDLCARHPLIIRDFFHMSPSVVRVLVLVWALAISFSRIALGRHYLSDVLAGSLIGAFMLYPISAFLLSRLLVNKEE